MTSLRRTSLAAGVLYLITFVSIPTLFLYSPVKEANYIVGPGPDTPVLIGAVLEIIVSLAGIGTAVALYPMVKRQNEGVALGFVGARVLEAGTIFAGVVCLLTVATLRQRLNFFASDYFLSRVEDRPQPACPRCRARPGQRRRQAHRLPPLSFHFFSHW